jgi:hypothetical protein
MELGRELFICCNIIDEAQTTYIQKFTCGQFRLAVNTCCYVASSLHYILRNSGKHILRTGLILRIEY